MIVIGNTVARHDRYWTNPAPSFPAMSSKLDWDVIRSSSSVFFSRSSAIVRPTIAGTITSVRTTCMNTMLEKVEPVNAAPCAQVSVGGRPSTTT